MIQSVKTKEPISGKVRGILCITCNTLLGMAKDDTGILKRAVQYLDDPEFAVFSLGGPNDSAGEN